MEKNYSPIKIVFITFLFSLFVINSTFAQAQKNPNTKSTTTTTTVKGTQPAKPPAKAPPVNTKNIKAKGIIAADMDCTVKVNGAAKLVNVKAYTASVVILNYGDNLIEANATDKSNPASFKTTIKVADTARKIIEVSFYNENKFLDYIKQGKVEMVETAIKKNPDLATNEGQIVASNPLLLAITNSQPAIVKVLMNHGASYKTPDEIYPMHKAIMFASSKKEKDKPAPDREMIDYFLTKGCKLTDVDDGGNTLLHAACRGIKLDLVTYLVEKGLDVNAKNDFNDTPLKIAENKGAVSIIEYLKSKGAVE